jgi:hypothetical protein
MVLILSICVNGKVFVTIVGITYVKSLSKVYILQLDCIALSCKVNLIAVFSKIFNLYF